MQSHPFSLLFFTLIFHQILLFSVSSQCLNDQKSKLLQLKESFQFDSALSTKLAHWNSTTDDCCKWNGVACDDASGGFITTLDLSNETILNATHNWKVLFTLKKLEKLSLASNFFYPNNIPDELQNLENLRILNLSNSGFVGQVPIALSRLKNLVSLDLSTGFFFTDMIRLENPDLRTFVENLTEIRELYLDGVNISKSAKGNDWCNALSSLSNLRVLSLAGCRLSGPIISSLSKLRSLSVIQLDNNNLSTIVPDFFANFSNLTALSLRWSNLRGKFPEKIFQVPTLEHLDLTFNDALTGTLPQFLKSASFKTIILSSANFSGFLPDSIGNLQDLSLFDVSSCNFSGSIPSSMASLTKLVHLDMSYNNFNGSIPSFQMSKNLTFIDLSYNHLQGSISSNHFNGLKSLANANFARNSLSGAIPPSLFSLPSLQNLILSNNNFDGQLPNDYSSLLSRLDLTSNHLEGPIPESFLKLESLFELSLSFNNFNGTVKLDSFQRLQNLRKLELSYNNLSIEEATNDAAHEISSFPQLTTLSLASCNLRKFPTLLRNQSQISVLDLSANHITGEIPNWIWNVGEFLSQLNLSSNFLSHLQQNYTIPRLTVLDLHANLLQGIMPIPPESAMFVDYSSNNFNSSFPENIYIPSALFFSISNNSISGVVTESLCNGTYALQSVDLSNNVLSGTIPSCLLKKGTVRALKLSKNKLSGTIPNTFPINCGLITLDLSGNTLEGNIPRSLENCKFLQLLNIGRNNFKDTFPCKLMNASELRIIILRSNRFYGELKCSWEKQNWRHLQIMDIAYNNFSGIVPSELFSNWRGLMMGDYSQPPLFLIVFALSYTNTVKLTIKGFELELEKILQIYASIDFSCNKFHGKLPDAVGELKALYLLNLSHNALTGSIPGSIGNLSQLGSLDLSMNQLTGMIPSTLGKLTFLSYLNLSFNQFFGRIPDGRQLQTFSDASFLGNPRLCGFQLNISCSDTKAKVLPEGDSSKKDQEIKWEYVWASFGFAVGLGITCWLILFNSRCSSLVDQILVRIFHEPNKGRTYRRPIRRLHNS